MKKTTITLISLFAFFASSCGVFRKPETQQEQNPATFDKGVVINGVRWATRNVDAPGTFAETPESTGMFFQWNRKRGWASISTVTGWDNTTPTGTAWQIENDPCPPGWRVPMQSELESLHNTGSTIATWNGVNGRFYGTTPYQIFLPATGIRTNIGMYGRAGEWGGYWSNTEFTTELAWYLSFNAGNTFMLTTLRTVGLPVRCVAKNDNEHKNLSDHSVTDAGVMIDGIRWATRNVGAPGTFVESPEHFGMLFQWNRKQGWEAIDEIVADWDYSISTSTTWYAQNDPCPPGWRIPTPAEFQSLIDAEGSWATLNNIYGHVFSTVYNRTLYRIFLPSAGFRRSNDGVRSSVGLFGYYWSSMSSEGEDAWRFLRFYRGNASVSYHRKRPSALTIRCVAIN